MAIRISSCPSLSAPSSAGTRAHRPAGFRTMILISLGSLRVRALTGMEAIAAYAGDAQSRARLPLRSASPRSLACCRGSSAASASSAPGGPRTRRPCVAHHRRRGGSSRRWAPRAGSQVLQTRVDARRPLRSSPCWCSRSSRPLYFPERRATGTPNTRDPPAGQPPGPPDPLRLAAPGALREGAPALPLAPARVGSTAPVGGQQRLEAAAPPRRRNSSGDIGSSAPAR